MSTGGPVGCRQQQQQPGSCLRCEFPRARGLASKTALPGAGEPMHMGTVAVVLPAEVPEGTAVAGR